MVHTKAIVKGYNPKPFFFKEEANFGSRYVAWTSDLNQLKNLVYTILQEFPEELDILFKQQKESKTDEFNRYHGYVSKILFTDILQEYELYLFSDGFHQLCVRREDTGEYIALDDHGILFIYSDSEHIAKICLNNNFENRNEKLIFKQPHWHYSPAGSEKTKDIVIQKLSLKAVD